MNYLIISNYIKGGLNMEDRIEYYYANNAKKLREMVDKIIIKLHFIDVDNTDFYSLANEIFLQAINNYDENQDFNGFLYSCLVNKFKTEMTRRNRQKRQCDNNSISIDTPISDEDGNFTIGDTIASKSTIEKEFFEEREEGYSKEMCMYLSRLSDLQKEVLRLISIGFIANEIIEELHITQKQYDDCYSAIHSYRNISILF